MKRAVRYANQTKKSTSHQVNSNSISAYKFMTNYTNRSVTENGAIGYRTTTSSLVDLNFMVSSLREREEEEIVKAFIKAYYEEPKYAVKWLFFLRDILEGLGERRSFRICLKYLAISHTKVARAIMELVPMYGRYDDWLILMDTPLSKEVCKYIQMQLAADIASMENKQPVSLLAKWLPSANASSKESRRLALRIAAELNMNERDYRKTLSRLRSYSKVVEVKISASEWNQVDYPLVPAKANLKYQEAFLRHDEVRRYEYLMNVAIGKAKLNSNGLMPYELVHNLTKGEYRYGVVKDDILTEMLWQKLLQEGYKNEWGFEDCIVVADGSGSMYSKVADNAKVSAIEVCHSLAIYFAEQLKGIYHNKAITFSETPQFIDLEPGKTLKEKLEILRAYDEVENTNIEAVFDLLLAMAVKKQVPKEEIPKQVLIISDMEFDAAQKPMYVPRKSSQRRNPFGLTLFQTIEKKYNVAGYEMPRLIFWNVLGRSDTIPLHENTNGISLISGFSQNAIKIAAQKDAKDPYNSLIQTLDQPRYDLVGEALKVVNL